MLHGDISLSHHRTDNFRLQSKLFVGSFITFITLQLGARVSSVRRPFCWLPCRKWLGMRGILTEDEIRQTMKKIRTNKTPRMNGLPYKEYLRLLHMFVPSPATVYNNWMKQKSIPQCFPRIIVNFVRKSKRGEDGICNLTMLKILAKILVDHLLTALLSLIGLEQCRAVKSRASQDSLYFARTIKEKVDNNAALINLN